MPKSIQGFQKGHSPWNKGLKITTNTGCTHFKKGHQFWLGKKRPNMSKEKHPNWKGGKRMAHGYLTILMPNHPRAVKNGYVKNCYLIMEKHLGRFLKPNEFIHHINHIRNDDRLENLQLVNRSSHCKIENPIHHRWH